MFNQVQVFILSNIFQTFSDILIFPDISGGFPSFFNSHITSTKFCEWLPIFEKKLDKKVMFPYFYTFQMILLRWQTMTKKCIRQCSYYAYNLLQSFMTELEFLILKFKCNVLVWKVPCMKLLNTYLQYQLTWHETLQHSNMKSVLYFAKRLVLINISLVTETFTVWTNILKSTLLWL